jgi:hypothetical protein
MVRWWVLVPYGRIKDQCKLTKDFPTLNPLLPLLHGKRNCHETKKIGDPTTKLGKFEVPKP